MKTGADPRYCLYCGDRYWVWKYHAARCPVPHVCECRPGWQHDPGCYLVLGGSS